MSSITVGLAVGNNTYTLEQFGGVGDGVLGAVDGDLPTGHDDTQALVDAIDAAIARRDLFGGAYTISFGPKRYLIDLNGGSATGLTSGQLLKDLRNITFEGVEGVTKLNFQRTEGWFNGAAGMDLVVMPDGFIRTTGSKYGGDALVVQSATYSTSTGVVACKMSALVTFDSGVTLDFTASTGTGAFASLSGSSYTTTTVTRTVATSASTASGNVLPFTSTSGMFIGNAVAGTNIPASTYITSFTSTTITLNNAITGTVASAASLSITPGYAVVFNAGAGKGAATVTAGTVQILNDGYRLTTDTIYNADPVICDITSGSRSGTTITMVVPTGHGIVAGNLIYSIGEPTIFGDDIGDSDDTTPSSSQDCFYTVGSRAVGIGNPVTVTLVTATTVVWEYGGDLTGQDTVMTVGALPTLRYASDCAQVVDSSVFVRGERVLIGSLRERGRDNEHTNIGAYKIIGAILSSTIIRFADPVIETYAVVDYARIFKLDELENITFRGITFEGKGHNPDTYNSDLVIQRGDTCLKLDYTHNLKIENCTFIDQDLQSVNITYCSKGHAYRNTMVIDQRDPAGAFTRGVDIQYGINYGICIDDFVIEENAVFGGRHAFVQGGSSVQTDFGVARNIRIIKNYCAGQWLEAISTHQGADTILFDGNIINGSRGGINPRYSRGVTIVNNIMRCRDYGVVLINDVLDSIISNNYIEAGQYPIWMKLIDNPTATVQTTGLTATSGKLSSPTAAGPARVFGNTLVGGRNSIYCIDTTTGLFVANGLEFDNNTCVRSRNEAVRVSIGDPAQTADGWIGSISGNKFYNCCTTQSTYQWRIANAKRVKCRNNLFEGTSTFGYVFLFEGVGTSELDLMGNSVPSTLYATAIVHPSIPGTGHKTDMFSSENVTIASGIATVKYVTTKQVRLRGEAAPAADDLDSIAGLALYQEVILWTQSTSWTSTAKHGAGFELDGNTDKVLNNVLDNLRVIWNGTKCVQTSTFMDHA